MPHCCLLGGGGGGTSWPWALMGTRKGRGGLLVTLGVGAVTVLWLLNTAQGTEPKTRWQDHFV